MSESTTILEITDSSITDKIIESNKKRCRDENNDDNSDGGENSSIKKFKDDVSELR